MAIKIDWSIYPDRERKAKFTQKLTPESPYKSAGVSVIEVKKLAKTINDEESKIYRKSLKECDKKYGDIETFEEILEHLKDEYKENKNDL